MALRHHVWIPFTIATTWFMACGPKDGGGAAIQHDAIANSVAGVVCDAFSSCDCKSGLREPDDCKDAVTPALAHAISQGELLGLRYYSECLGKTQKYIDELGCKKANQVADDDDLQLLLYEARACKLLAGDAGPGDACTAAGELGFLTIGDSCGPGLVCADICIKLPTKEGDLCDVDQLCPPATACLDPEADGVFTCEAPAKKGKRCNPHDLGGCGADLVCDPTENECAELPGAGQPCPANTCKKGNTCDGMVCQPNPTEGQPCAGTGLCNTGLICDTTTATCVPLPGDGEMCPAGQCADGFVCGPLGACIDTPPVACALPEAVGFCLYRYDAICDEPATEMQEGTGLCKEGTDPEDCAGTLCPTVLDGKCDEPGCGGTDLCPVGTDEFDCNGVCGATGSDSGTGTGTDSGGSESNTTTATTATTDPTTDTGNPDCPYYGDGECDEPEGTNLCPEGTDPLDCP
ncbi:MAG TPA: hypothetical protein VG755_31310 [Nannocystaceae bacterium]|nr:hypothetical protein [Nannocystaceae bacterium]